MSEQEAIAIIGNQTVSIYRLEMRVRELQAELQRLTEEKAKNVDTSL